MPADKDVTFDPYHKWLGIPRDQRPVTHYQLLGISPDEADKEVIEDAAIRQSAHVRTYQLGTQAEACQRVLNEIAQAKRVLLDAKKRKEYDATLSVIRPAKAPAKSTSGGSKFVVIGAAGVVVVCILGAVGLWLSTLGSPDDPRPVAKNDKKPPEDVKKPVTPKVDPKVEPKVDPVPKIEPKPKTIDPELKKPDPTPAKKKDGIVVESLIWRNDLPKEKKLLPAGDMLGIFAGGSGDFRGLGESFLILVDKESGDWQMRGVGVRGFHGYGLQVTGLPAGWFSVNPRNPHRWWRQLNGNPPTPPVELIPEHEGVCFLGGMSGSFRGGGESVRVSRAQGSWILSGSNAGSGVEAWAVICRFGKAADRGKIRISEVEWSPGKGPLKLLDVQDGFCALTGIRGNIEDWNQQVQLTVKDDAWYLEGRDNRSTLTVHALRVSISGKLPSIAGDKEIVLAKSDAPPDPKIEPKVDPKVDPKVEPKKDPAVVKARKPAPDAAVHAAKQKELRTLIKAPGAKASPDEVNKHADLVLGLGLGTKDDDAMRYTMIRDAFELTYPLGDLDVARRATDALDGEFDVSAVALRATTLSKAAAKATPEAARVIAEVSEDLVKDAIAADDLDRAKKVAAIGHVAAQQTKLTGMAAITDRRYTQARELEKAFEAYKTAETALKSNSADEKANGEAGAYLALGKGDWVAGLKLLVKGPAGELKTAAEKDLARPTDVDGVLALADAWADVVEQEKLAGYKAGAAWRAANYYRQIAADVVGLPRLKLEKRMMEIEKIIPVPVTLPTHRWTFDGTLRDSIGEMGLALSSPPLTQPTFVQGRLRCLPKHDHRAVLTEDWGERTLELWFYLAANNHRDAHIMTTSTPDGGTWDGLAFNNERGGEWYHGSSFRHRSRNVANANETAKPNEIIHLAVAYGKDNGITLYRNGKLLDGPFIPDGGNGRLVTYRAGKDQLLLLGTVLGDIEEARVYGRALTPAEVATSYRTFKK